MFRRILKKWSSEKYATTKELRFRKLDNICGRFSPLKVLMLKSRERNGIAVLSL